MKGALNRQQMAEQLWLQYFNRTLYRHGAISTADMRRMQLLIQRRTAPIAKK